MKNTWFLILSVSTSILLSCNQKTEKSTIKDSLSSPIPSPHFNPKTYLYRGVFSTIYDRPGVGTMALTMVEGNQKGTYVFRVDYGKGIFYEGQAVQSYTDHGTFYAENSAEFGTVYVMKGQQPVLFYYRPLDNKLTELGPDKKQMTDIVLTGIDPKDSSQTRVEVLSKHSEREELSSGLLWSAMTNKILDQNQANVILEPLSQKIATKAAYIIFNKNQSLAELFLPEAKNGLILKRIGREGGYIWTDGHYELIRWKGYVLRYKDGNNLFAGK